MGGRARVGVRWDKGGGRGQSRNLRLFESVDLIGLVEFILANSFPQITKKWSVPRALFVSTAGLEPHRLEIEKQVASLSTKAFDGLPKALCLRCFRP